MHYRYRNRPSGGVNFIERLDHCESHNKFQNCQLAIEGVAMLFCVCLEVNDV